MLSGADLYRLSCESCHEPAGTGVPPEINSLIGPVQATSPVLIRQQMKQRGIDIGTKMVRDLSSQAEAAIRARLTNGGTKMPPFRHLQRAELDSVFAYLNLLAGVPGAEGKQIRVRESAMRVGELLVKGTCHICHDATGPGSGGGGMVARPGVIPSLASLPKERAEFEVVRKVREGLPMPMPMMTSSRGEMPLFPRLTPEEISAAFEYLASFPPRP
ncbi:MAG: c-type cytochrome [Acidobacteriota bacterium]